jgi:succinoglycan biosynthesis transport protein ExoP
MAELKQDFELAKVNYGSLLDKTLVAGMATDMERKQQAGRFTMLDPPRVPERPVGPKTLLMNTAGFALSIALAMVVIIVKDAKSDAVLGEWELPDDVVILGRIPRGAHEFRSPARLGEMNWPT